METQAKQLFSCESVKFLEKMNFNGITYFKYQFNQKDKIKMIAFLKQDAPQIIAVREFLAYSEMKNTTHDGEYLKIWNIEVTKVDETAQIPNRPSPQEYNKEQFIIKFDEFMNNDKLKFFSILKSKNGYTIESY